MKTFRNYLKSIGIAESRHDDLQNAFDAMHKALCALDNDGLKAIKDNGGLSGVWQEYENNSIGNRELSQDMEPEKEKVMSKMGIALKILDYIADTHNCDFPYWPAKEKIFEALDKTQDEILKSATHK